MKYRVIEIKDGRNQAPKETITQELQYNVSWRHAMSGKHAVGPTDFEALSGSLQPVSILGKNV